MPMCGQVHYHPLELKQHLKTSTESGEGITTLLTAILNVSLVKKINLSSRGCFSPKGMDFFAYLV